MPQVRNLKPKYTRHLAVISRFTKNRWGIRGSILRMLYKYVTEMICSYACRDWEVNLNFKVKKVLFSTQQMFTLVICRAYRTTPSDYLVALAGLGPGDLVIARENAFTNVISFGVSIHCFGRSWEIL
ncbi:hypothetical protein AVEN_216743-1 [Araneus ventricosus]|uniref:Uncharacterized protein n=1 Tax=Araneus ventricosus TaxID=182803 RepID=A0A4Y2L7G6_ARAVE|nr:hypothetical protein AVEN_216743-1 [Araneus ventricosus]